MPTLRLFIRKKINSIAIYKSPIFIMPIGECILITGPIRAHKIATYSDFNRLICISNILEIIAKKPEIYNKEFETPSEKNSTQTRKKIYELRRSTWDISIFLKPAVNFLYCPIFFLSIE
jgi:hypothetical protein